MRLANLSRLPKHTGTDPFGRDHCGRVEDFFIWLIEDGATDFSIVSGGTFLAYTFLTLL